MTYAEEIRQLVLALPFKIDCDYRVEGRRPTMANSEFLTNKEQGDWAEQVVLRAINEHSPDLVAVKYGRSESPAAGDSGFEEYYAEYQRELNELGKKPDLLIFRRGEAPSGTPIILDDECVARAVAAIEVRSSSFLAQKYSDFMEERSRRAVEACLLLKDRLTVGRIGDLLQDKSPEIYRLVSSATDVTFKELDFRRPSWRSSADLQSLSDLLAELKEHISTLHKRDYLSITPKLEDIALVNRWVQRYGVPHHYLQVFFDKAYVLPFRNILTIAADSNQEGIVFSVEEDVKNQCKTTIKINVQVAREVIGKMEMPEHRSAMKELERGRLLFYVTFEGGRGYLDQEVFAKEILGNG